MLVKFSDTTWLNIDPDDVLRIDIDADHLEPLRDSVYYVEITFSDGKKMSSGYFKTIEEARTCVENFKRVLTEE